MLKFKSPETGEWEFVPTDISKKQVEELERRIDEKANKNELEKIKQSGVETNKILVDALNSKDVPASTTNSIKENVKKVYDIKQGEYDIGDIIPQENLSAIYDNLPIYQSLDKAYISSNVTRMEKLTNGNYIIVEGSTKLKILNDSGEFIKQIEISSPILDIATNSYNHFFILTKNKVDLYNPVGALMKTWHSEIGEENFLKRIIINQHDEIYIFGTYGIEWLDNNTHNKGTLVDEDFRGFMDAAIGEDDKVVVGLTSKIISLYSDLDIDYTTPESPRGPYRMFSTDKGIYIFLFTQGVYKLREYGYLTEVFTHKTHVGRINTRGETIIITEKTIQKFDCEGEEKWQLNYEDIIKELYPDKDIEDIYSPTILFADINNVFIQGAIRIPMHIFSVLNIKDGNVVGYEITK